MSFSVNSATVPPRVISNEFESMKIPDWELVPHKGMQSPPKDELIKIIKDLGIKRANAVSDAEFKEITDQLEKARAQYLSAASPDRRTLYKQALKKIEELDGTKKPEPDPDGQKTLMDFLNERDGLGSDYKNGKNKMKNDRPYPLAACGTVTAVYNSQNYYNFEIKYGGETVMSIDTQNKWVTYTKTTAELKLNEEFNKIFQSALKNEQLKKSVAQSSKLDIKV